MPTISPSTTSTSQPATTTPERDVADGALFGTFLGASSQELDARARDRLSPAVLGSTQSLMVQQERERLASGTRAEAGIVRGRGGDAGDRASQQSTVSNAESNSGRTDGRPSTPKVLGEAEADPRTAHRAVGERAAGADGKTPASDAPGRLSGTRGQPTGQDSDGAGAGDVVGASVAGLAVGGAVPVVPAGAPAATTATAGGVEAASNAKVLLARLAPAGRQGESAKPVFKQAPPAGTKGGDEAARAQLVRGLASLVRSKGGDVSLELDKGPLGKVRVEVGLREGVISARFVARTDEARGLLERSVSTLRSALEDRGLVVQRLEIVGGSDAAAGSNRDSAWNAGAHGGAHDGAADSGEGRERGLPQGRGAHGVTHDAARSAEPSGDERAERDTDDMGVETLGLDTVA